MLKLDTKKIIKIFALSIKILNLLKIMSKNELINAINISKPTKNNKKNIFKSKIEEIKQRLMKPLKKKIFKSKRKEIKESLKKPSKKKILKSIIKEIKEILHDPIINSNEKIKQIKKILYDSRNNLSKQEEDNYKPERIGNAFSNNYIEYKSNGNKEKTVSIKDYLDTIKRYLSDIINDHITQGEWKIKLTKAINFNSSKDSEETCTMYSPSDNIEVTIGIETDKIIEDLFYSFVQKYQKGLEESMRRSEFVFDSVDSLYYKLHKLSLNRGGSYIHSLKWLKNKKESINPTNNDDKCFKYAIIVALNHEQIKKDPQRITKIKPFIDQYHWKEINFSSRKEDWNEFGKKTIDLNILYIPHNTKEIRHAYKSKYNLESENEVTLLKINHGKKWHYLAVKKLSALFRGIASKHNGDFCCLNCFHSFRTENKFKKHRNACKDHDYCNVEMPKEDNKILKYNHGEKSMKVPFIIYVEL